MRWTIEAQGTELARTTDDACVFLGAEGCTVHTDRPLVCRLYPLGRHVDADGGECFSHLDPHPQSAGECHRDGTIGSYLSAQGAGPFMRAADRYYAWWCRFMGSAAAQDAPSPPGGGDAEGLADALDWLDMDAAVAHVCRERGIPPPEDLEARTEVHLQFLHDVLAE